MAEAIKLRQVGNKQIILFCVADFAKGIFTGMIANYLLYFLQPTLKSAIEPVVTQGYILGYITLIGLVKAIGHVFDAVTDPLIAGWSDKCKSKYGRRVPFMRIAAIPYALSALLIFCAPMKGVHWFNNLWVSFFIIAYFFFYTLFTIPHTALLPELVPERKKRVTAYSISSFAFVTGSAVVYAAPMIAGAFKNSGTSANAAYQLTFLILTCLGAACLLITAFGLKEKEYVNAKVATVNVFKSLKQAFGNKYFRAITFGQLFETTAMAFFQFSIMYYVTELLGLSEQLATPILAISIVASIAMYPVIVAIAKRYGSKVPLVAALAWFVVAFMIIYFISDVQTIFGVPFTPLAKGIFFALFVAYPFGALNVLPSAMMSDVIQYDTLTTGENREGIFAAARNFLTKLGQSLAVIVAASVVKIGAAEGENIGRLGVKLTAIVAAALSIIAVIIFLFYNNKALIKTIERLKGGDGIEPPEYIPDVIEKQ